MGLRIIERRLKRNSEVTDTERLNCLETEADNWVQTRNGRASGGTSGDNAAKSNLISHYKTARERITSAEDIQEMAKRIRIGIIMDSGPDKAPHQRVDIATLLELL